MSKLFPLSSQAVQYAWRELTRRAGIAGDERRFRLVYGQSDDAPTGTGTVIVSPCTAAGWRGLPQRPTGSLDRLDAVAVVPDRSAAHQLEARIPVLLWGEGCGARTHPFAALREDGSIIFHADIIAATLFMLSRWEESAVQVQDEHGRFPGRECVAYRQGFLDRPIIDEYAFVLRRWLEAANPGWKPKRRRFRVRLSHDVDHLRRFPDGRVALRRIGSYVVRGKSPIRALTACSDAVLDRIVPVRSRYFRDLGTLARLSIESGIGGDTFYFMAAGAGSGRRPPDYDPESPWVRGAIDRLRGLGFEIGFHPGYETFQNPDRFAYEKWRFDRIAGPPAYGARQHFLRCRFPDTWRQYEEFGLSHDATAGYADQEGFRCGTCQPFRPYDLEQDRELELIERPLIVMEGTLRGYRRLDCMGAEARILELARRCRRVEGEFSLLWHNHALSYEWHEWGGVYRRVVRALAEL